MSTASELGRVADALFQVAKAQKALAAQAKRQANATEALLEVQKVNLAVSSHLEAELSRRIGESDDIIKV